MPIASRFLKWLVIFGLAGGMAASVVQAEAISAGLEKRLSVALVTGLPIIWGEGDISDTLSGRNATAKSYDDLRENFDVQPLDSLEPGALDPYRLVILAQPRAFSPLELVVIDNWVREGGRILILADPALRWHSRYGLGDPRSPPAMSLLDPLLDHWGLRLDLKDIVASPEPETVEAMMSGRLHKLTVLSPGLFAATGEACRVSDAGLVARCTLGTGRALLIADADLLADALWNHGDGDNAGTLRAAAGELLGISRDKAKSAPDDANKVNLSLTLSVIAPILLVLALVTAFLRKRCQR